MGTTAEKLQAILDSKADIKDAIEAKGVTVGDATLAEYAGKIGEIQQGMTEAPENDVNFYDYDGFRVASYTIAEAKALTELPTPPTHEGLTFQEWNWTLADIQSYNRQYIDVGANYITNDGHTHIKVKVPDGAKIVLVIQGRGLTATMDWGDGQNESHTYGSGSFAEYDFEHTFTSGGIYDVVLSANVGQYYLQPVCQKINGGHYIFEINSGTEISYSINYALSYLSCLVSFAKTTSCSFIRGAQNSNIPQINIPNKSVSFSGYYPLNYHSGRVSFPKDISNNFSAQVFSYSTYKKVVVPESTTQNMSNNFLQSLYWAEIISIPDHQFATLSTGKFFAGNNVMRELDVVQGYVPTQSMVFSQSICWTDKTMVKLFNKLGTTTNAITLTFGATNLAKLTEEQKAIATNKGYTLA